ncbi:hypothetical protein YC2023_100334 [Brassica napus]
MHLVAVLTNIDVETGCRRKGQKMDGIENGKEASSAYTGILNVIEYMGSSIAIALYNNQVNVLAYAHISLHSKPSL